MVKYRGKKCCSFVNDHDHLKKNMQFNKAEYIHSRRFATNMKRRRIYASVVN